MQSIGSTSRIRRNEGLITAQMIVELHRPYIDDVTIKCPKCGRARCTEYRKLSTAGSTQDQCHLHSITIHLKIKKCLNSSSRLSLFQRPLTRQEDGSTHLLAESTLLFNKAPYENVIVLGHVQDENGQKMSKIKGNAVDPFDALQKYGADAIRWYFYINQCTMAAKPFPWQSCYRKDSVKFMGTLWNTYAFFVLYANIDDFDATKYTLEYDKLSVMDKWILFKLNTLVKDC